MKLGYNEIMITSMYFDDIEDFINLEMGVKRFQGNVERFHFNPIPLNYCSRKLFTNIETFHIYNRSDEIFNDGKIFKKVIWYLVSYSTYLQEKEQGNICKNIVYTQYDRKLYGNTIPSEVKSLGDYCFKDCYELTTINIPSTIIKLGDNCFDACKSLKSITIPTTISKIGNDCFEECYSLKSINIPSSISKIGFDCFDGCTSLTSMNIENLQFISKKRIFMNEPVLISIEIPDNIQIINGKNIEKKDINKFIIPSSITKLGDYCFSYYPSLTLINIPSSIIELGYGCFYECSSLKSINIQSSVSKLGNYCFSRCTSLKSINISSSITKLGYDCFEGCRSLTSINIPSSIIKIGKCCFRRCKSLKSINIPSSIKEIGNSCFYQCSSLISIDIPSSITLFGDGCFYECDCEEELKKNERIPTDCFK
ncbi:hypothetical protein, conserved [Entamoeba dispar SAW760]|uniref:Leucine rich repeat containing protein BspA family protein n=1 Tax=Entamoeba dispar (strain ATCC PRA-260 / SAW760) TaxID=370354 RepID=B0EKE1_ENTDS|nr:uncharacterized protein EDI_121270 [Entamoeba dispar SAW760]EDR25005.1 hypothetical protein, conserved [Entamoeba dispar SAW760]|eukprot:EDR25005.1 hypothetical protein, conserved [Entamoeba dispar SAW760]